MIEGIQMKIFRKMLLAVTLLALGACSTINFNNGRPSQEPPQIEQWHHVWALDLYEGSPPVDLKAACGDAGWKSVKTETSFLNWLGMQAANFFGPIWFPETVQITCNQ